MKEFNTLPLQAISPKIDYTDFYSKYQKRRNPFLLLQEKHLPHIRLSIDTNINPIETKNSIKNIFDLPLLSPLKTNSTYHKI